MKKAINIFVLASLVIATIFASQVLADDPDGKYYRVRTITLADGTSINEAVIMCAPSPLPGYDRTAVELPEPNPTKGVSVLADVPAFNWSFGCSATSGAMIAGYYDRIIDYANMYTGPTSGGTMPLDNSSWPDVVISGETRHQCPLSATRNGLDGRTTGGHVDDYWIRYGATGPDPYVTNGWPEHTPGDCTGDFMKTSMWECSNPDGSTTFNYLTSGAPTSASDLEGAGLHNCDGGYGLKLFYESRGYTVTNMYNQLIRGQGSDPNLGFTFDQYKAEIDAGRPVIIHLRGHTVVGLGYDDATNLMYIHDTWDYNTYTMPWGGTYQGMQHKAVTIVQLAAVVSPTPPGAYTVYLPVAFKNYP